MSWPRACHATPGSGCPPGQRWSDWAWITDPGTGPACQNLLIRRSRQTKGLLQPYFATDPSVVTQVRTSPQLSW